MTLIDLGLLCLFPIFFILLRTFDRKKWVGLTNEEAVELMKQTPHLTIGGLLAVEDKLRSKNT